MTIFWTCSGFSTGAASAPGAGSAGGEAETSAFSSIRAISTPTGTVSSTLTRILDRRPATGDGSSAFILSVIISARDSSRSTQSPSFFNQLPMVPSATDSPKRGILIGIGIFDSFVNCNMYLYHLYRWISNETHLLLICSQLASSG